MTGNDSVFAAHHVADIPAPTRHQPTLQTTPVTAITPIAPMTATAMTPTPVTPSGTAGEPAADALAEVRRRAVAATKSGVAQVDVARIFGVSRQTVARWVRTYQDGGDEKLRSQRRGRRPGEQLALCPVQQSWVINMVIGHPPEQLGLRYRLWTRQALVELINRELGVALSTTSIRNYLIRWGLAGERSLLHTLRSEHAALAPETSGVPTAWIPGAETLWADWTRTCRPALPATEGDTVGESVSAQLDVTILRAVSNRGAMYFVAQADPFDGKQVCEFLDRLRGQLNRKINVVLHWRPGCNTEAMSGWQARNTDQAAVRFSGT
jgi:transposase